MFCTQCGTQVGQGINFCKNCGARVSPSATPPSDEADANAVPTAAPLEAAASVRPPRENGGNKKLIIIVAGVAVVVLAAAGVYFGSDLLKPSANQTPPPAEAPLAKATETPPLPSFEDTKDTGSAVDNPGVVNPPLPFESAPPLAEAQKPASRADVPPAPSPSQMQRAGQDAPSRAARPSPAARGGAAAGIYETRRATPVYEEPSASAKTVANIPQGTQVTVVSSSGDWLEVHSKRGNPPGFIRRDDATFIEKSN